MTFVLFLKGLPTYLEKTIYRLVCLCAHLCVCVRELFSMIIYSISIILIYEINDLGPLYIGLWLTSRCGF